MDGGVFTRPNVDNIPKEVPNATEEGGFGQLAFQDPTAPSNEDRIA